MVIDVVLPSIDVREDGYVLILPVFARNVEVVCGNEVEILRIPFYLIVKLLHTETVVPKLSQSLARYLSM